MLYAESDQVIQWDRIVDVVDQLGGFLPEIGPRIFQGFTAPVFARLCPIGLPASANITPYWVFFKMVPMSFETIINISVPVVQASPEESPFKLNYR